MSRYKAVEPTPSDERAMAMALNSAAIHLLRNLATLDRSSGLTPARLSALSVVVFGGPCSLTRLARAEAVSAPTMSRLVSALETNGLVTRTRDPDNARRIIVAATARGRHLMLRARETRLSALVEAFGALAPSDRRHLDRAVASLATLAEQLSPAGAQAHTQ